MEREGSINSERFYIEFTKREQNFILEIHNKDKNMGSSSRICTHCDATTGEGDCEFCGRPSPNSVKKSKGGNWEQIAQDSINDIFGIPDLPKPNTMTIKG